MSAFFKVLCVLIFALTSSLLVLFTTFKTSGYSREFLKIQLKKADVYTVLADSITENLKEQVASAGVNDVETDFLTPFTDELNSSYLELKSEQLIDDTLNWVPDDTAPPPVLSFADLKDKISKKNPQFFSNLKMIEDEMIEARNEESEAAGMDDETTLSATGSGSMFAFFNEDPVIHLEENLTTLKSMYKFYKLSFYITLTIALLSLILIVVLSSGASGKFFWTGVAATTGLLAQGMLFGLLWLFQKTDPLPSMISSGMGININRSEFASNLMSFAHGISAPWFTTYFRLQTISLITLLIISVTFFILSKRSHAPSITQKKNHSKKSP